MVATVDKQDGAHLSRGLFPALILFSFVRKQTLLGILPKAIIIY